MDARAVGAIVAGLEAAGVQVWLDGGWGVDALLETQTRAHADLDVIIAITAMRAAQRVLERDGFVLTEDERPTRFVLAHPDGRSVDVHPVTFEGERAFQELQDGRRFSYPPGSFEGRGVVAGRTLRCVSAQAQLLSHLGYPPQEKDALDVHRLCRAFNLPIPEGY